MIDALEFSNSLQEWGFYFQMVGSEIQIKEIRKGFFGGEVLNPNECMTFNVKIWHDDLFEAFIEGVEEQHLEKGQDRITDFYLYCKNRE